MNKQIDNKTKTKTQHQITQKRKTSKYLTDAPQNDLRKTKKTEKRKEASKRQTRSAIRETKADQ